VNSPHPKPDFLPEAAGSVANPIGVQRCATASRGANVLNRLQLIGLLFTDFIPNLRKFNFCCALNESRWGLRILNSGFALISNERPYFGVGAGLSDLQFREA
jgi:hypothetical protein